MRLATICMLQENGGILSNGVGPLIPDNHHSISAGTDQLLAFRIVCKRRHRLGVQLLATGQHSEAGGLHAAAILCHCHAAARAC